MNSKNVLHVIAPGPIAGAEKVVITGLKALVKSGTNVTCLIIQEKSAPELAKKFKAELTEIDTHVMETSHSLDFNLMALIRTYLKESNFSIIHTHGFKALFYLKLTQTTQRHIHTHHGNTAHTFKVRLYEYLAEVMMKRCDAVVAVSQAMKDELKQKGVSSDKIFLIPNMLSLHLSSISRRQPQGRYKFVFIGRLSLEKGLQDFIPLIKPPIFLDVVGEGPMRKDLEEIVKKNKLENHVTFLGYKKDIRSILESSDALILPSHREGLPMTLIEAVCYGIPILASAVGGIPTIVSENGVLFTPQDKSSMKSAISHFLENYVYLSNNSKKMAHYFREEFSADKWAERSNQLYIKI
jgi:glycosyltransferase involved in cell wall biosynthesis